MLRHNPFKHSLLSLLALFVFAGFAYSATSSVASPKNILVDDFENASMRDLIGGYIGSDIEVPGTCRFSYTWSQQDTFGKATHSLKVDYDVRARGSYTYLWFHLGSEAADHKVQTMDLSGMSYLSFWVKSSKRRENFKIELHCDSNRNGHFDPGQDDSSEVYAERYAGKEGIRDEWRKVVIPLADFKKIKDFSCAMEIVFVFENSRGNSKGTIYLDEIFLGTKKLQPPGKAPVVLPTPKTLLPEDAKVGANVSLACGTLNYLAARQVPSDVLEGTGFEVSWDEGRSWSLVGIDYEATKDIATVAWDTPPLPPSRKVLLRAFAQGTNGQRVYDAKPLEILLTGYSDAELIDELTHRSFLYFLENQHPQTGLFLDSQGSDASTAVAGFGLAALVIGAKEGWIDPREARDRALKTLRLFESLQRGTWSESAPEALGVLVRTPQAVAQWLLRQVPPSHDGFFYHFMKPESGMRAAGSEVSVVDTTLLLLGALTAGEYFGGEVQTLAKKIYGAVQWDKFYDPQAKSFRMGWSPEKGYFPSHWDYYTDEAVLLHILAAGSRTHPTPADSYYTFRREKGHFGDGEDFIYSWTGALFTHQYTAAWLDMRGLQDKQGCDWWENSRRAVAANRDFCWYNKDRPLSYGPHRWGISSFHRPEGYVMHFGVLPNGSAEAMEDGTISPIACASSITFLPFDAMSDLKHQVAVFPFLLGPYGLRNAYNLSRNWFSNVDFGLDTGLLLLSLENFRSQTVWKMLEKNSVIRRGIGACGFKQSNRSGETVAPMSLALPAVPPQAPKSLAIAQDLVQRMERLCLQRDAQAYRDFIAGSDKVYAEALTGLDGLQADPKALSAAAQFHREWLQSLIAIRQAAAVPMRRHLWKMLQRLHEVSNDPASRMSFLHPYLTYVSIADMRDFQDAMYSAFKREAETSASGAAGLEEFAKQCREGKHFALAARAWNDALELRSEKESQQAVGAKAREIAEGFFKLGRLDEAIIFDRVFLKQAAAVADASQAPAIEQLGHRYESMGALSFSKECYAAQANLPAKNANGTVAYRLAKPENRLLTE